MSWTQILEWPRAESHGNSEQAIDSQENIRQASIPANRFAQGGEEWEQKKFFSKN